MKKTIIKGKEGRKPGVHETYLVLPNDATIKQLSLGRKIQKRIKFLTSEEVSNDS